MICQFDPNHLEEGAGRLRSFDIRLPLAKLLGLVMPDLLPARLFQENFVAGDLREGGRHTSHG